MKTRIVAAVMVAFCTLGFQNALAGTDIGLKAAGFEVGMVSPEDLDATFGLEGFADLGTFSPNVRFSTHLGYWSTTEEFFDGGEVSLRDIALSARAEYFFPVSSSKVRPFAGGGLGLHLLHAEVFVPEQDMGGGFVFPAMTAEDSQTEIGLDLGGGVLVPMNAKTDFRGELWYSLVDNADQLSMKVGLAFKVGQ